MEPLVSIITPVYNCSEYLLKAIESIKNQTYQNWECIIIDDCSTDNTREIISNIANEPRIIKIFLDKNMGVANARNIGIERARGKYIAFLDADDLWKPDKLTKQISYMEEHGYKFTYTNYEVIDKNGQHIKDIISKDSRTYKQLLRANSIGCLTVVIDSNLIKTYKMPYIKHEDYATWLNILRFSQECAYNVGEVLASYRKLSTSVSSNKLKALGWTWNIYRKNQMFSFIKSVKHIVIFVICTMIKYIKK